MPSKTYKVSGMTCGHCVEKVEKFVGKLSGVHEVKVELENGNVAVSGEFNDTEVVNTIERLGYSVHQ
ncbi:heavy-metal-associated domain-containing protein [Wandonia haliotis]|uniref:Heavy-metal-associated domain-containing protein n=1 Tax=Wandonia haliotis TaxID=574963 RepID=A0ABP3Y6N8_9FLAO